MKRIAVTLLLPLAVALGGCDEKMELGPDADALGHTAPTQATAKANAKVLDELPFSDRQDFEDAKRGLIASHPGLIIEDAYGGFVWNLPAYEFIDGEAPASVNPSLWRQANLNQMHGLFKVTDGIYQLRGFDLSNMTIIEGKTGWIIVDPLTAKETAAAAIAFARKHLDEKPIVAMIFTHSHIDHFAGVFGIMEAEEIARRKVRIIAPEGFMEEATSENVIAGMAMGRRAMFMFGRNLPRSQRGHVDSGLGISPSYGTLGIMEPTDIVDSTPQKMTIDGVRFVFQNAPGSEAPAELAFYLPKLKAFCGAEIISRNMHNLYTLRGAKVRDALKWSNYIDEEMRLFNDAEIYFASHHWPLWGKERIIEFLEKQRDTYKYIHDQTLRLANAGYTPREIAEEIELPESLRMSFPNRGYYGTVRHNSKAVYQGYLGWYDGNPANLNPLPPTEAGVRYVELMGGADKLLAQAELYFDKGEYRWVAEILSHLVFAEPGNTKAKALLARTYDQLGYQSESGPWRDVYLTAAYELRHGAPERGLDISIMLDVLRQTPLSRFFDSMAARLNGPDAEGTEMTVNMIFTDLHESYVLALENAVLHHYKTTPDPAANATIKLTRELFLRMAMGKAGIKDTLFSDDLQVEGSRIDLVRFFSLFDKPTGTFNIVTP